MNILPGYGGLMAKTMAYGVLFLFIFHYLFMMFGRQPFIAILAQV